MSEESGTILDSIETDEFYKSFLQSAQARSQLTHSLSIAEQVRKLGEGIEVLNKELHKQVVEKHGDLLQQANHASKLEKVLGVMNGHVQNLVANAERIKMQIVGPYQTLENHTKVLSRLHLASHILRQVSRIQQLSKRLTNINDPVQKATILQELEQLTSDSDLTDIDAVTSELRNIRAQQQKVVKLANSSLLQGIINENSVQATTALNIFTNLGTVKSATQNTVDIALGECRESLKSTFDIRMNLDSTAGKSKGGPGKANLTSSQGFRTRVWANLEKTFSEEIYQQCKQIKFLQTTISNLNITELNEIASNFWLKLGEIVTSEITGAPTSVLQMLEEDYPKLLKSYHDMATKLNYGAYKFNRTVLEKCENAYLSNSWTRLLEPTQSMFASENNAPTHDQIDSLIRNITSELSVALVEANLTEKIAKNVSKCVRLYAVKTEQLLATGPEASQVIAGALNSGQNLNVKLANTMYYLHVQIQRMLANMKDSLSPASVSIIMESLSGLDTLTSAILQPLIGSINATIETILVTIHLETDWAKLQVPSKSAGCSPYMRELIQFIGRIYPTYLASFENKEILSTKCSEIVLRSIDLMVRHSSILRPISQGGRVRLQSDYGHMEQSLKILCPFLTDLGRPYRLFKSVATLVTLTPEEIIASQAPGSSVPHSTVLFLLFSFASNELASPHQNTGWSINKLSAWLDEHTNENERLDLILGALQRYETIIRQKNLTNFDPVYPIMSEFISTAVKQKT